LFFSFFFFAQKTVATPTLPSSKVCLFFEREGRREIIPTKDLEDEKKWKNKESKKSGG